MAGEYLKLLTPEDVTETDVKWLIKSIHPHYTGETAETLFDLFLNNRAGILRVHPEGIMTFKVFTHPGGKELRMHTMAGRGIMKNFKEVKKEIHELAKSLECSVITWFAGDRKTERMYEIHSGYDEKSTMFMEYV